MMLNQSSHRSTDASSHALSLLVCWCIMQHQQLWQNMKWGREERAPVPHVCCDWSFLPSSLAAWASLPLLGNRLQEELLGLAPERQWWNTQRSSSINVSNGATVLLIDECFLIKVVKRSEKFEATIKLQNWTGKEWKLWRDFNHLDFYLEQKRY